MKIHECLQGSDEWFTLRAGIPTASDFSQLVTPKKREIAKANALLNIKLAERWLGRPLDAVSIGFAGEQGKILEEDAIPRFELDAGMDVTRVGFVTNHNAGCSPDGLIIHDGKVIGGLEVKSPKPETHTDYLLGGTVPDEYFAQCQGGILVTGASVWWFMSYARGFPSLIVKVEPDEQYLATLSTAINLFNERLNKAYARLVDLNGGEPTRAVVPTRDLIAEYYHEPTDADFEEFLNSDLMKTVDMP